MLRVPSLPAAQGHARTAIIYFLISLVIRFLRKYCARVGSPIFPLRVRLQRGAVYRVSSTDFSYKDWDCQHELPEYLRPQTPYPGYVVDDLGQAMRDNPRLKRLSANGYFDLATPLFGTERGLCHMELDLSLRENLTFRYHPSGHMVYLNPEALGLFAPALPDSTTPPRRPARPSHGSLKVCVSRRAAAARFLR
jgi:hypothetical protein